MDYKKEPNAIINARIKNQMFGAENWTRESALIKWNFNNWADMGPVIQRNYISVFLSGDDSEKWTSMSSCGDYEYNDNNPLRAAAIVYLMCGRP